MIDMQTQQLICPGCDQPLNTVGDSCDTCGLDYHKAAQIIQEALVKHPSDLEGTLDPVNPRIGEYLIDLEMLTPEQLEVALREQRRLLASGQHRPLGQIMAELGIIDLKTFEYYLALQVLQLKLQLVVGRMNLAAATGRPHMVSTPIQEMKQNLLQFAAAVNEAGVK